VSHQFIGNVPQVLERFQLQSCLKLIDNIYRSHRPIRIFFQGGAAGREARSKWRLPRLISRMRRHSLSLSLAACVFCVIVTHHLAATTTTTTTTTTTLERDVRMNDATGMIQSTGSRVLIATTNRQTDAIPFLRRKRHARQEYLLHYKLAAIMCLDSGVLRLSINVGRHFLKRLAWINDLLLVCETAIINDAFRYDQLLTEVLFSCCWRVVSSRRVSFLWGAEESFFLIICMCALF